MHARTLLHACVGTRLNMQAPISAEITLALVAASKVRRTSLEKGMVSPAAKLRFLPDMASHTDLTRSNSTPLLR